MELQKVSPISFREKLKVHLNTEGRSQRWLMKKLQERGLILTETKLSNRINGIVDFKESEKFVINDLLGTEL